MKDELHPSASDSGKRVGEHERKMQLAVAPEPNGWQLRGEARSRGEPCAKAELFEETELLREVGREEGREGGRKWEGWRRRDGGRE